MTWSTGPARAVLLCALAFRGAVRAAVECSSQDSGVRVRWDDDAQDCIPPVCNGARLGDIPDASGHLRAAFACQMDLKDTASAQQCLKGMHIVMLGDSTLTETMHDLVLLLSGLGSQPEEMAAYLYNATRQNGAHTQIWVPFQGLQYPHGVQVDFYGNHRNMTVTAPSLDTVIRHRFTGHFELTGNFLGIQTFTSPGFQQELACLLHEPGAHDCGARRPDMLVINSGMHDIGTAVPLFAMAMRELARRLRKLQDSGIHVLWKGNNLLPKTHGLDVISRHYIEEEGLTFVNTEAIMKHFAEELAGSCCSDGHTGEHIGAIAMFHNAAARLTVSSMVTQEVLRHACSTHTATVE